MLNLPRSNFHENVHDSRPPDFVQDAVCVMIFPWSGCACQSHIHDCMLYGMPCRLQSIDRAVVFVLARARHQIESAQTGVDRIK